MEPQKKSVGMILTYSELKAKIDEHGGMVEFIEHMKAEGHTHVGLLPDDWSERVEKAAADREHIVMAIDPGSDTMAIRRFLIQQRGIRGDKSPIFVLDDAQFISMEMSEREMDKRMTILTSDMRFNLPVPEFPEDVYAVLAEEEPEPVEQGKGPRKRSKYQRGNWWNR